VEETGRSPVLLLKKKAGKPNPGVVGAPQKGRITEKKKKVWVREGKSRERGPWRLGDEGTQPLAGAEVGDRSEMAGMCEGAENVP